MPSSQKIGSFRPLTFLGNGRPVRPSRPQTPNRQPGAEGIRFSGKTSVKELNDKMRSTNIPSTRELGNAAVRLQKSLGISVNVTI